MRGTSSASLDAVAERFEPVLRAAGAEAATLGDQLFAVVDALDGSGSLRRALSDPSRSADDKGALVVGLLRGKVDDRVVAVVEDVARARWTSEDDLTEAVEQLAFDTVLASAQSAGTLDRVEDEIFRFERTLVGERDLRRALTDRSAAPTLRGQLVRALLDGKVEPATLQLVERAAATPRSRSIGATLTMIGRLAARRRQLLVASVRSATPLSLPQIARLTELLERTYGRPVQLNIAVDPEVIGGLWIQVGSEVVDSTVLARLDDARRRLAG